MTRLGLSATLLVAALGASFVLEPLQPQRRAAPATRTRTRRGRSGRSARRRRRRRSAPPCCAVADDSLRGTSRRSSSASRWRARSVKLPGKEGGADGAYAVAHAREFLKDWLDKFDSIEVTTLQDGRQRRRRHAGTLASPGRTATARRPSTSRSGRGSRTLPDPPRRREVTSWDGTADAVPSPHARPWEVLVRTGALRHGLAARPSPGGSRTTQRDCLRPCSCARGGCLRKLTPSRKLT